MNRSKFLQSSVLGTAAIILPGFVKSVSLQDRAKLDPSLVETFVGAGHSKPDVVKSLYAEHPTLLNAAHDWGGGDFETALGAASHVGRKELASWLIEQGAQANLFTACLFGQIDVVKMTLEAFPAALHAKGPHGFTLLHHAQRGGEEAEEVLAYLESLGAKETKVPLY